MSTPAYPRELDVRPLTTWPGDLTPAHKRKDSQFAAPLATTVALLTRELRCLGARHPVLEVAIPAEQWRLDGRPRAQAKAEHPGVVLSLPATNVGPLRYATDIFTTWQDNLRAIALSLEALRKVDRYGVTRRGEQYQGFRALPGGSAVAVERGMSREDAALVLVNHAVPGSVHRDAYVRSVLDSPDRARAVFRDAAHNAHPDKGGTTEAFQQVEQAARILGVKR